MVFRAGELEVEWLVVEQVFVTYAGVSVALGLCEKVGLRCVVCWRQREGL